MTEEEQDQQSISRMSPENYQSVIDRLKAENQRLSELLWGSRCVYCGEVIGKDKQNQDIADDLLRKHVEVCPKHPVASLKAELAQAKAELRDLLAPTIRLLQRAKHKNLGAKHPDTEFEARLNEELSRLRSLRASGDGDCAGG